jgi:hypothetical protein
LRLDFDGLKAAASTGGAAEGAAASNDDELPLPDAKNLGLSGASSAVR